MRFYPFYQVTFRKTLFVPISCEGKPFAPNTVTHNFIKIAKKVGRKVKFHDLRYS